MPLPEEDLIIKLRQPYALGEDAARAIEDLLNERELRKQATATAEQAKDALERYREGLKHGDHDYDDLSEAMELLGSPVEKIRIRKRKTKSRADLILQIDGLVERLDEIGGMVAKMVRDPNATPQTTTNAKAIMALVDKVRDEAKADIERCDATVSSIPAGGSSPITDHCVLEAGHEGDHQGQSIRWPQEVAVA